MDTNETDEAIELDDEEEEDEEDEEEVKESPNKRSKTTAHLSFARFIFTMSFLRHSHFPRPLSSLWLQQQL